jgi:hypothetical protein
MPGTAGGDDVALLTFAPFECAVATRLEGQGGGCGADRVANNRDASSCLWGFAFLACRPINWLTRGLESNGRLGVPSKSSADIPSPFLASFLLLHTIPIANPGPAQFPHPTFSNLQPAAILPPGIPAYLIVALGAAHCALVAARFVLIVVRFPGAPSLLPTGTIESPPIPLPSRNHPTPRARLGTRPALFFVRCTVTGF